MRNKIIGQRMYSRRSKIVTFEEGDDFGVMLEIRETSKVDKNVAPEENFASEGNVKLCGDVDGLVPAGKVYDLDALF